MAFARGSGRHRPHTARRRAHLRIRNPPRELAAQDVTGETLNSLLQDAQAAGASVGLKGDRIAINGGIPLRGRIELKGAKNLVTKAMVAALLGEGPSVLRDVPDISDVRVVRGLLEIHGVTVKPGVES